MSHPPAPTRAQRSHVCAPSLPANARHGPIVYKGCHYRFSIMPLIGGRECSLCARWLLVGWVCRAPAPLRRANDKRAPLGQSGVRPLGRAFLCGGPPFPAPPAPPSPYMYPSMCVCVRTWVCVGVHSGACSVSVFGAPRSASVLRALARMPDAARCAPSPASALAINARVVSGRAPGGTWRACGPSALNAPVRAPRAPSRMLELAFGLHTIL